MTGDVWRIVSTHTNTYTADAYDEYTLSVHICKGHGQHFLRCKPDENNTIMFRDERIVDSVIFPMGKGGTAETGNDKFKPAAVRWRD